MCFFWIRAPSTRKLTLSGDHLEDFAHVTAVRAADHFDRIAFTNLTLTRDDLTKPLERARRSS